jgi:HrpA-like RNA helicase
MSATVAAELYQGYFGVKESPIFVGARCHPINKYFVEDIGRHLQLSPKEQNALSDIATKCMKTICQVAPNQHYMMQVRGLAVQIAITVGKPGSSILIFIPGIADIVDIMESFEKVLSLVHIRLFQFIVIFLLKIKWLHLT